MAGFAITSRAETTHVLLDANSMKKVSLPANLRLALLNNAPGAATDHAGYIARM